MNKVSKDKLVRAKALIDESGAEIRDELQEAWDEKSEKWQESEWTRLQRLRASLLRSRALSTRST